MTIVIPAPIVKPFCNTGDKNLPPVATSTSVQNQETGIPPLQATKLGAGGIPVSREEFNGTMNFYTQQIQALVSGVQFTFDAAVSLANGGYPEGIILYCASNKSYQRSLVDNNTANFVTTPSYINDETNWTSIYSFQQLNIEGNTATPGGINLFDGTTGRYTRLESAASLSADQTIILPPSLPTSNGQVLSGSTLGVTSWVNPLGNQIIFIENSSATITNGQNLKFPTLYDNTPGITPSSIYDVSTGIFTAPVTATYHFEMAMYFENSSADFSILILGSLLPAPILWFSQEAGISRIFGNPSRYLKLTAGETIYFQFSSSGILSYGGLFDDIPQFSVNW